MKKTVSIVAARRELGRLAQEVSRTGQAVILTRRGRAVARITPEPDTELRRRKRHDAFAELRGTVRLNCTLDELCSSVRQLRAEFAENLDRRAALLGRRKARGRA
ncbi:MAG TPA: type II toxin-antitoxin system Phd/YefM family antitoxin [Candidatus Acidoferrales bacterium]|nr:type II toxin-antitoxin system Phd/YefM family antitoxin [Candidatus Acidoferrales bacterium]